MKDVLPFIQNVAKADIPRAFHSDPGPKGVLIQIVDPDTDFPVPRFPFAEIHQFRFWDIHEGNPEWAEQQSQAIQPEQAKAIAGILTDALANRKNVIVHCHAGICRSGAVVAVGVRMGFTDPEKVRLPNPRVKRLLEEALGLEYKPDVWDNLPPWE